ncbi:hypothetical protein [Novosphingobium capsulatum]|uniref:hypothetical protein n=1 Tax=Novosphingobium capsulatum TaxID=13688 RepID=UPI0007895A11|nr:hypothetical protein [Novosphingobium capsulatum]WQD92743.1 hypothetical protein U0041_17440 [Novosphingobium capsulatum]
MSAFYEGPPTHASVAGEDARPVAPTTSSFNPTADFLAAISEDLAKACTIARAVETTFTAQFLDAESLASADTDAQENLEQMRSLIGMALDHVTTVHNKLDNGFARLANGRPRTPMADHVALQRADRFQLYVSEMNLCAELLQTAVARHDHTLIEPFTRARDAAVEAVITAPATTASDIQQKLAIIIQHQGDQRICDSTGIDSIEADIIRLAEREGR